MKISLIISLFLTMNFSPITDWQHQNLKGKVKRLTHTKNDFQNNQKTILIRYFNPNGFIIKSDFYSNGKHLEEKSFQYNQQNFLVKSSDKDFEHSYQYKTENQLIKCIKKSNPKDKIVKREKITHTYFNKKGWILAESVHSEGWTIYNDSREYFEDGKLKSVTDPESGLIYEFKYDFGQDGVLFQKTLYDYKTRQINYFVYEKQGGLISYEETDATKVIDEKNPTISKFQYENLYDKKGNITQIKAYDLQGNLIREEYFSYEYF